MVVCTINCVSLNVEYLKKAHTQMPKSVKIDMIVKNNNLCCIFDRSYDHPQPDMSRVEESCFAFRTTIINGLKSSGVDVHLYVPFHLDVWRYLMQGKGEAIKGGSKLYQKKDFDRFVDWPDHWSYIMNLHGTGRAIDFPIKVRPFLGKSCMKDFVVGDDGTIVKAPILYTEKLSIYFVKRACNPNNI
jgi:hypothetical protein